MFTLHGDQEAGVQEPASTWQRDGVPQPRSAGQRLLIVLAVLRYAIPVGALALIPSLQDDHVPLLMLLRPGKEIMLLAGFRASQGQTSLGLAFLAMVPLGIMAVWVFFALGRSEGPRLVAEPPRWLRRAIPQDVLLAAQRVIGRRGVSIAVPGRIAALPPTILAAAAGTTPVSAVRFLAADAAGAVLAFALTVGAGWALGDAYERAGGWLTAAGVAILLVMYRVVAKWIEAELELTELDPAHVLEEDLRDLGHDDG